jgi:hypothetical protein
MLYQTLRDFWRVGYHADPLHVTLEHQDGSGRFDDPERQRTVLYGAEDPRTCILEIARPWKPRPEAGDIIHAVPEPELASGENDAALLEEMSRHAERDREIAAEPLRMPIDLYEKKKVHVELERSLDLANLDDLQIVRALFAAPSVRTACDAQSITQIDRSVLMGREMEITRAISGHMMRVPLFGTNFPGLACPSRHPGAGFAFTLFEGRYALRLPPITEVTLSPDDPDIQFVATELGLLP